MSWDDILSKEKVPQKVESTETTELPTDAKIGGQEKVDTPEVVQTSTTQETDSTKKETDSSTEETKSTEPTPLVDDKKPVSEEKTDAIVEEKVDKKVDEPDKKVEEKKPKSSIWDTVSDSKDSTPTIDSEKKEVTVVKEALSFNNNSVQTNTPQQPSILSPPEFDMQEVTEQGQIVITIYAHKNHGKTSAAFSFPGKIACISFDKKAYPIKVHMNKNNPRIRIYDGIRYLDESDTSIMLDSHVNTFKYILYLLGELAKDKPDWIVIDATEVLQGICEMVMRARNNFAPFAGVQWTYWKERKIYLKQIHRKAMDVCKRGIIYATYVDQEEIIKNGETFTKIDRPKWTGIQLEETDVVIRIKAENDKSGLHFFASVEGSKVPMFKTGDIKEITDVGLAKAFNVQE